MQIPPTTSQHTPSTESWPAQFVIRWGYVTLLVGGLMASWALQVQSAPPWLTITGVIATAGGLIWLWERHLPHTAQWRVDGRRLRLDILHTLISSGGISRLVEISLISTIATLAPSLGPDGALWPIHLPLGVQLAMALLIGEFGAYWAHRLCHTTSIGWRIHAVHHSTEALHIWASGRTHPLNTVLVFSAQSCLVVLLGAPSAVIGLMAVFTGINGLLQHANIRVRPGLVGAIVSTTVHHRWHHSRVLHESNTNFGNNLIVWDRLFGTIFAPSDRLPGDGIGMTGAVIPETFASHWMTPFVFHRYETREEEL